MLTAFRPGAPHMLRGIVIAALCASGCAREYPAYATCPFTLQPGLNRGLAGDRSVFIAAPPLDGGLHPAVFVFHGHGGDALGEVSSLKLTPDVADGGLVIIAVEARDANATPVWDDASDEPRHNADLSLFDGLRLCALAQFDVDPARVTATGASGGAFFSLFLARVRGEHLAAAVAFSGVMRRGVGSSAVRPALLLHYGGAEDVTPALDAQGTWTPAFDFTAAARARKHRGRRPEAALGDARDHGGGRVLHERAGLGAGVAAGVGGGGRARGHRELGREVAGRGLPGVLQGREGGLSARRVSDGREGERAGLLRPGM